MPKLSEELANLRRTAPHVARAEIEIAHQGAVPPAMQKALREPSGFLARLASLLEEFWNRAVASHWGLLHAKLEGEVLFRARSLALDGLEGLFQGMHRDVSYHNGRLTIQTDSYWDGKRRRRGILLVPSIFSWPDVFLTVRPPWQPTITYPSRGIADLWSDSMGATPQGLSSLLGSSSAKILSRMQRPQTTMEIAAAVKLSPAAASEQVTKLWRAGILERTRIGRRVFYSLNATGRMIFSAFQN